MTVPPLPEPRLIDGRFELEAPLGSGGMADVFRARDLRYNRPVAIKILRADVLDVLGAERFRREIAVTAAFTHPHILSLLESGETTSADGRPLLYYVMPLIEGESMRDRLLQVDHLSVDEAVRITREVLEALRYAHEHGVIHRDIKPANILLSGGHAVVADFGVARPLLVGPDETGEQPALTLSGVADGNAGIHESGAGVRRQNSRRTLRSVRSGLRALRDADRNGAVRSVDRAGRDGAEDERRLRRADRNAAVVAADHR
jgi:serine/threonine protein kinase